MIGNLNMNDVDVSNQIDKSLSDLEERIRIRINKCRLRMCEQIRGPLGASRPPKFSPRNASDRIDEMIIKLNDDILEEFSAFKNAVEITRMSLLENSSVVNDNENNK